MKFKSVQLFLLLNICMTNVGAFTCAYGDIVITEVMVDPTPALDSLDFEYVEIYNRKPTARSLKQWKFWVNQKCMTLPDVTIEPGAFLVFSPNNTRLSGRSPAHWLELPAFPSLPNTEAVLAITDNQNQVVFSMSYHNRWYGSGFKADGGWSLESRDASCLFASQHNWTASVHPGGGTPGFENSLQGDCLDALQPVCRYVQVLSEDTLELTWNKTMDVKSLSKVDCIQVFPEKTLVKELIPQFPEYKKVLLILSDPLEEGVDYQLKISQISDVSGFVARDTLLDFGLPVAFKIGDWRINELLYDPIPGGFDYVELVHAGKSWLALSDLVLSVQEAPQQWGKAHRVTDLKISCAPGSVWLLSLSSDTVFKRGNFPVAPNCLDMNTFPSLNNRGGTLGLLSSNALLLDEVVFGDHLHHPTLSNTEGVALERRNPTFPSDKNATWISAPANKNYGTPGFKNAQWIDTIPSQFFGLRLRQTWFSPNHDGLDDRLSMFVQLQDRELCNLSVFNLSGQLIRVLARNALIGRSETIEWDGTDSKGQLVTCGRYILYMERFQSSGRVEIEKMVVSVLL